MESGNRAGTRIAHSVEAVEGMVNSGKQGPATASGQDGGVVYRKVASKGGNPVLQQPVDARNAEAKIP